MISELGTNPLPECTTGMRPESLLQPLMGLENECTQGKMENRNGKKDKRGNWEGEKKRERRRKEKEREERKP